MSSHGRTDTAEPVSAGPPGSGTGAEAPTPRQIDLARAVVAIVLAVGFVVAVGDEVPTATSTLPLAAAAIITAYPVIDVVSSLFGARRARVGQRALQGNAAVSAAASLAIGVAAFGSDAGATLLAFGTWAVVSGAIQFVLALGRRRAEGGQLLMLVSGGLSALAGLSFVAASGQTDVNLGTLSFYMLLGAVLFIASARRR